MVWFFRPSFPLLDSSMLFDLYLGGFVAFALALYLGYALLHPEEF